MRYCGTKMSRMILHIFCAQVNRFIFFNAVVSTEELFIRSPLHLGPRHA